MLFSQMKEGGELPWTVGPDLNRSPQSKDFPLFLVFHLDPRGRHSTCPARKAFRKVFVLCKLSNQNIFAIPDVSLWNLWPLGK
jgi:hypothetical protein